MFHSITIKNLPIDYPVGSKMTKEQAIEIMYGIYNDVLAGFREHWPSYSYMTDAQVRQHWHSLGWMFHKSMEVDTGEIIERKPLQWLEDNGFVMFDDNWSLVTVDGKRVKAKKVLWTYEYPTKPVKPVTDEEWDGELPESSVIELH